MEATLASEVGLGNRHPPSIQKKVLGEALRAQEIKQLVRDPHSVGYLALPNYQSLPTGACKGAETLKISQSCSRQLWQPIILSRARDICVPAPRVLMPEASMHENHLAPARKHNVGRTGQVPSIDSEAITEPVRDLAHAHLSRAAGLPNARHAVPHDLRNVLEWHANRPEGEVQPLRCRGCPVATPPLSSATHG
jgi:hypothetical protein